MSKTMRLNNNLEMPMLGLGVYLVENNETSQEVIEGALKNGYRAIDTASVYRNEEIVGNAIKACGINREEIFVTTKLFNEDQRKHKVMEAFETSLKKLGLDYVDLYLIHWPVKDEIVTSYKILEQIYKSGRAKSIGVSNFQIHHLEELMSQTQVVPALNQIEMHPLLSQDKLHAFHKQHGIVSEAWAPIGRGVKELLENPQLIKIAQTHKKTVTQVILRWHIQRDTVVIPKSNHLNRVIENSKIFDFELSQIEMEVINSLNKNHRLGPDPDNFNF
jgi:diketogulonate reductase-like aldo/keto reductase